MAAQSNGRAKKPKKPTANGHTNGHANGHIDNSKLSAPAIRTPTHSRPKKTMAGSLMNVIARLTTWYILITVLFRCPSSLTQISETSPRICSPYLQARSYVTPYLDPYYQQYVAPQVEKVKPYVDRFESQIYTPAASFTKEQYTIYGAHRVEQAKKYAEAEWNKSVRPQLQTAQDKVKEQYEQHLSEHVKKASDLASPYYEETKKSLDEIYHLTLLPAYDAALPYARTAYAHGHHTVAHIIFPLVQSARDTTWTFILRTVWPQVRILYGDNVEPQLVRIRERLGRYRDQQKIESVVEAAEPQTSVISEETKVIPSTDISSATSSVSPSSASSSSKGGWGVLDDFFGGGDAASSSSSSNDNAQVKTPTIPEPPKLTGAELKAKLNEDLRKWQTKFAVAADKGAEDLEQRVEEITKRQVENGVNGHGKALVVQLEETAKSAVEAFKRFIKETVKSIPEDATEEEVENAYEKCVAKTREFGLAVREKAQNIRSWKATYDQQTDALVQAAVRSTVEVLEKIHGLGLQEVGMRWAWTDGVTYKDWQNYHKLRTTLQEWQKEVEAVGSRHDGLRIAHEEAKSLEDQAMTAASKMVEELVRLKNVSKWKIWAGDATDDFTDKAVPPRVFKAAQQVLENAESASSQVSEAVVGSETPATESISSSVEDALSGASSKIAESIIDHETVEAAESVASDAKKKLSEVVIDSVSSATSSASEILEHVESAASESKEVVEEAVSSATESPKKVFGGAMAQVLAEAKQVIFDEVIDDDDEEPTPVLKNLQAQASSRYSEAVSVAGAQFENAKSQFSELVSGTPKPAHETMLSMIEKAYSDSVAAASERLEAALHLTDSVKSYAAGPTQGYFDSVSSIASSRLSEGLSVASAQFSSQPTPVLEGARRQYYEAIGIAHGRYSEFIEAASSAVYGPQQGTIESIVSVASESAESLASAASESAESLASEASSSIIGSETPWSESAASQASQSWESLIAKASHQVYGAPTPWAESVYHQAGEYGAQATSRAAEQYSAVHSLISELVVGKEPDFTESVMNRLSSAYYTGIPEVYASASSVVNSIFTPPPAIETILSQANEQLNAAVESASIVIYGTPQGAFEQAQESFSAVAANAQSAVSVAIFGTPTATGYAASVSSVYNSVSSVASENVENAASAISSAVYGPEQGAVESASSRLAEAIEAANSRINELYAGASKSAAEAASHVAEAAADATQRIKDEL